jgi:Ca2+-binding RTX toxin-like protein
MRGATGSSCSVTAATTRCTVGGGADYMEGQQGRDRMFGGKGGDTLDAADRETAGTPDTVDCGPGIDTATVNTNDVVSKCEDVTEVANP